MNIFQAGGAFFTNSQDAVNFQNFLSNQALTNHHNPFHPTGHRIQQDVLDRRSIPASRAQITCPEQFLHLVYNRRPNNFDGESLYGGSVRSGAWGYITTDDAVKFCSDVCYFASDNVPYRYVDRVIARTLAWGYAGFNERKARDVKALFIVNPNDLKSIDYMVANARSTKSQPLSSNVLSAIRHINSSVVYDNLMNSRGGVELDASNLITDINYAK